MQLLETDDRLLVRLTRGEDVLASLQRLVRDRGIGHAPLNGIGAVEDVVVGAYDLEARSYRRRALEGPWEVVSLMGNVGWADDEVVVHAHALLSDLDCRPVAGHLFEARVHVTLELVLWPGVHRLERSHDAEVGLKLWNLLPADGSSH